MKRHLVATAAVVIALVITGCDSYNDEHGMGDAPVATTSSGKRGGDDSPATCTNMPDGFGNVCTKCVLGAKPWRMVVTTNTSYAPSNIVLVQDPQQCGGDWVPGARVINGTSNKGADSDDDS